MNRFELVKELLDLLQERYIISIVFNIIAYIGIWFMLYSASKSITTVLHRRILRTALLIALLIVSFAFGKAIFDFSDAIQVLKDVFEGIMYESGIKRV